MFETTVKDISTNEVAGKLVTVSLAANHLDSMHINEIDYKDRIKKSLVHSIAEQILKDDLIEFTKSPHGMDINIFRARAFLLDKKSINNLRTKGKL